MQIPHIPVLLDEVLDIFKDIDNGYFLDTTLGYGGHSEAILKAHNNIKLIACDQDQEAIDFSTKRLENFSNRIKIIKTNFKDVLDKIDNKDKLLGILVDLGMSSLQIDKNERGFSINSDFLDMRMNIDDKLNAYEVVNHYTQDKLEYIFKYYGELKDYKIITNNIIQARQKKPIQNAKELTKIINTKSIRNNYISKAILAFQAIRIEVNDELKVLQSFLQILEKLKIKNCTIAIISFHSLEDRIVKNMFKKWTQFCKCDNLVLKCECDKNNILGKIINKKVIIPTALECKNNPRASSAKMRVFRFD